MELLYTDARIVVCLKPAGVLSTDEPGGMPELLRRAQGHTLVGLDAISLMESGLGRLCACTVAVLAPAEDRVRRIMARDGISEDYARLRISAQQPDAFYRERCSHILENNCATPAQFREQARIFFRSMLREIEHL